MGPQAPENLLFRPPVAALPPRVGGKRSSLEGKALQTSQLRNSYACYLHQDRTYAVTQKWRVEQRYFTFFLFIVFFARRAKKTINRWEVPCCRRLRRELSRTAKRRLHARLRKLYMNNIALLFFPFALGACRALALPNIPVLPTASVTVGPGGQQQKAMFMNTIIPKPVAVTTTTGTFKITAATNISVEPGSDEVTAIGDERAERRRRGTGYPLPVRATGARSAGRIHLATGGDAALGEEGYELTIASDSVTLTAHRPAGLFYGIQTIRQLLPAAAEQSTAHPGSWALPAGPIPDHPRLAWRRAMLGVARPFFRVPRGQPPIHLIAPY